METRVVYLPWFTGPSSTLPLLRQDRPKVGGVVRGAPLVSVDGEEGV